MEKINGYRESNESLKAYLNRLKDSKNRPYSGNYKYYLYKKIQKIFPERTINDNNVSKNFSRNRGKTPVELSKLMELAIFAYTTSSMTLDPSDIYLKFAIIILTSTNCKAKNLKYITNEFWRKLNTSLIITDNTRNITVVGHQFLYEVAKRLIPLDTQDPPTNSVVRIGNAILNKKLKNLYIQMNPNADAIKSLGLSSLSKLNKDAIFRRLQALSVAAPAGSYVPEPRPELHILPETVNIAARAFVRDNMQPSDRAESQRARASRSRQPEAATPVIPQITIRDPRPPTPMDTNDPPILIQTGARPKTPTISASSAISRIDPIPDKLPIARNIPAESQERNARSKISTIPGDLRPKIDARNSSINQSEAKNFADMRAGLSTLRESPDKNRERSRSPVGRVTAPFELGKGLRKSPTDIGSTSASSSPEIPLEPAIAGSRKIQLSGQEVPENSISGGVQLSGREVPEQRISSSDISSDNQIQAIDQAVPGAMQPSSAAVRPKRQSEELPADKVSDAIKRSSELNRDDRKKLMIPQSEDAVESPEMEDIAEKDAEESSDDSDEVEEESDDDDVVPTWDEASKRQEKKEESQGIVGSILRTFFI